MRIGNKRVLGQFQADTWQRVYSNTLTEAATSITISDLDGDTDEEYRLIARVVSGANTATTLLRINNDSTANIYGNQSLEAQATNIYPSRGTASFIYIDANNSAQGALMFADLIIHAKSGFVRTVLGKYTSNISGTTVTSIGMVGQSWNNTADNITSLVIFSDVANGLGVGTVIELYAKKSKV